MKISVLTLATALGAAGLPPPNHCPLEGDCGPGIVLPLPVTPENELTIPPNPLNNADEARTSVEFPGDSSNSPRPHKPVPLLNTDSITTPSLLPDSKRQISDIWIFGQSALSPSALAWAPSATATTLSTAIIPAKNKRQPDVWTSRESPASATTVLPIATAVSQSKRQIFDIWIFAQKTSLAAPEPTSTTEHVKRKRQIFDIWIFAQKTSSAAELVAATSTAELPAATAAPKKKRQIFDIWIFAQKTSSATELPAATSTAEAKAKRQIFDIWIFAQKTSSAIELPTAVATSAQVLHV